jgi:hypothetical protein
MSLMALVEARNDPGDVMFDDVIAGKGKGAEHSLAVRL